MQRITLSGMMFGLSLSCFSGVLGAYQSDEPKEKAKAMRKEATVLPQKGKERGDKKDRPEIEKEARHLKERLRDLTAKERKMTEAQAPKQQLAEVREQIAETERELHRIDARHADKAEFPPAYRPQAEKLEAAARRIHHLRVAAENLKLAEAHDIAQQLMEKAEGLERELNEGKQRLAGEMQKLHGGKETLEGDRDLRAENERLRSEIKELRQKLEKR